MIIEREWRKREKEREREREIESFSQAFFILLELGFSSHNSKIGHLDKLTPGVICLKEFWPHIFLSSGVEQILLTPGLHQFSQCVLLLKSPGQSIFVVLKFPSNNCIFCKTQSTQTNTTGCIQIEP